MRGVVRLAGILCVLIAVSGCGDKKEAKQPTSKVHKPERKIAATGNCAAKHNQVIIGKNSFGVILKQQDPPHDQKVQAVKGLEQTSFSVCWFKSDKRVRFSVGILPRFTLITSKYLFYQTFSRRVGDKSLKRISRNDSKPVKILQLDPNQTIKRIINPDNRYLLVLSCYGGSICDRIDWVNAESGKSVEIVNHYSYGKVSDPHLNIPGDQEPTVSWNETNTSYSFAVSKAPTDPLSCEPSINPTSIRSVYKNPDGKIYSLFPGKYPDKERQWYACLTSTGKHQRLPRQCVETRSSAQGDDLRKLPGIKDIVLRDPYLLYSCARPTSSELKRTPGICKKDSCPAQGEKLVVLINLRTNKILRERPYPSKCPLRMSTGTRITCGR